MVLLYWPIKQNYKTKQKISVLSVLQIFKAQSTEQTNVSIKNKSDGVYLDYLSEKPDAIKDTQSCYL